MRETIVPLHFPHTAIRSRHGAYQQWMAALILFALWMLSAPAHAETVSENDDIKVMLVDQNGKETSVYRIPSSGDITRDILFRTHVPADVSYSLWTFEITNPSTGQSYQMAIEGRVPPVIHWDGNFTVGGSLTANQTYYIRLLLLNSARNAVSSKVRIFTSQQATGAEFARSERERLGFYAFPTGGLYYQMLKTKGPESSHFPTMAASLRLAFNERHSFGFTIETSPNILSNVAISPNGFFYSHISVFYLTRIWGALPHPPVLGEAPEYAKTRGKRVELPAAAYGAKSNFELGIRFYSNVMRGFGLQSIDKHVSRESSGLILTAMGDRRLGAFRVHGALEGGYSIFKGALLVLQAKTALTYDRLEQVTPGLEFKYQLMTGNAADDPYDGVDGGGPQGILNHVLMGGFTASFKI